MMELYVSRSGTVEGPYPLGKVQEMLQQGLLTPTDLGAAPGASDWSPLSQLLDAPAVSPPRLAIPPPLATPPPLRAEPDPGQLDQQFFIDGRIPPGTHGKSVRQVVNEVASGGRLVVYQYVFSLLVITFRRNTSIHYVPPGRSGAGAAFQWSLIPLFFGWWGLPWGIIYTIAALWRNTAGGVDVTEPVLAQLIGPAQADAVVRRRPKPAMGALWGLRALIVAVPLLFPLLIVLLAVNGSDTEKERAKLPGYAQFKKAENFVAHGKGTTGRGNTAAATQAAASFSSMLKTFRTAAISEDRTAKKSPAKDSMNAWCETHDKRCLFIVQVPDLRHFTDDAKKALGQAAWLAAQISAATLELPANADLAVAIRGVLLYDRLLTGSLMADFNADSTDAESMLESSIRETRTGSSIDADLIRYFASDPAPPPGD